MKMTCKLLIAAVIFCIAINAEGQIRVDLKRKVETQVNNRANKAADKGISKGLDKAEEGIKDAVSKDGDKAKTADAKDAQGGQPKNEIAQSQTAPTAQQEQTQLQSYSKYDFVPGDKIILFEDFSQDALGDFPALWTTDASGEINNLNIEPGNWFNLNSTEGTYWLMQDIEFPQNFIIEMDIVPKKGGMRIAADLVLFGEDQHSEMDKSANPGTGGIHLLMEKANWNARGYKKGSNDFLTGSSSLNPVEEEKANHVIVWVQNRRLRVYHKGGKVLDLPTIIYEGSKFRRLCFKLYRGASCSSYISNIKITTASPDMRSKLLTEGKLISYGIYFDVNKDIVKPESYGTLKEIANVLTQNPDVRVKIVGHTDSDGADAANLDLSKRRGAAVKSELVKTFGIEASRLESDGMGESQPVVKNDTPSDKALNRRVEFIKL